MYFVCAYFLYLSHFKVSCRLFEVNNFNNINRPYVNFPGCQKNVLWLLVCRVLFHVCFNPEPVQGSFGDYYLVPKFRKVALPCKKIGS